MMNVTIVGRAVRDIRGLQARLRSAGFVNANVSSNESPPLVIVTVEDEETKDPGAEVAAFVDSAPPADPLDAIRASRRAGNPYTPAQVDTILDRLIGL